MNITKRKAIWLGVPSAAAIAAGLGVFLMVAGGSGPSIDPNVPAGPCYDLQRHQNENAPADKLADLRMDCEAAQRASLEDLSPKGPAPTIPASLPTGAPSLPCGQHTPGIEWAC